MERSEAEALTTAQIRAKLLADFLLIISLHHFLIHKNLKKIRGKPTVEDAVMQAEGLFELEASVPVVYRYVMGLFRKLGQRYQLEQPCIAIVASPESIHCRRQAERFGTLLLEMARREGRVLSVELGLFEALNALDAPMTKRSPLELAANGVRSVREFLDRFNLWGLGQSPFPDATEVGGPTSSQFLTQIVTGERQAVAFARDNGALVLLQILTTTSLAAGAEGLGRQLEIADDANFSPSDASYGQAIVHAIGGGAIRRVSGPLQIGELPPPIGTLLDIDQAGEGD